MEFEVARVNKDGNTEEVQIRQYREPQKDEQGNELPYSGPALVNFTIYNNDPAEHGKYQEGQRLTLQ